MCHRVAVEPVSCHHDIGIIIKVYNLIMPVALFLAPPALVELIRTAGKSVLQDARVAVWWRSTWYLREIRNLSTATLWIFD